MFLISISGFTQSCPTYSKRNNGNGSANCHPADGTPSVSGNCTASGFCYKTGQFEFSTGANDFIVEKVYVNNVLLQNGTTVVSGNVFFGNVNAYTQGSNSISDMCFYSTSGAGGVAPAGNFLFVIKTGSTTLNCNYAITSTNGGGAATTTAGTVGSDQTICSGSTPALLTSTTDATNYSSYKWQSSTTSATSGFTDISGATSSTHQPTSLTQTTYFQRLAVSGADSYASNVVTVTVISAGTISPSSGTWTGSTQTFTSNGTSGGTWSVVTSPASGVATIDASSGVLTNTLAANTSGSGTITYSVSSGGTTCTSTRTFNLYNNSGTLPVTWETVSAQKQNGQVLLNWSTASEQNTKVFEVQYSTNTTNWDVLGTIKAAGNSSSTRNYSFTHQSPLKNSTYNYYRVLQRDLDGKYSYSKIVSIIFNEPGPDFLVYPNPADKLVTIYLAEASEVSLINSAGSVVWRSKLSAGRNQLPLEKYSSGVYYIRTKTGSQRLVIQ